MIHIGEISGVVMTQLWNHRKDTVIYKWKKLFFLLQKVDCDDVIGILSFVANSWSVMVDKRNQENLHC